MSQYAMLSNLGDIRLSPLAARAIGPLAVVGALYSAYQIRSLLSFTWIHFLRPSSLKRYKDKQGETWAVVTGASDGIGKGFAEELADQGFNVVLHGRNEAKLKGVQGSLEQQFPHRKFQRLILDAETDSHDSIKIETEVGKISHLNIRVLINNVAGGGVHEKPIFKPLVERKQENINGWIDISARFPTQFTRVVLPTLMSKQSALIMNIGSGASEFGVPYISTYSGCKAYNKAWSECLAAELMAEKQNIEVLFIVVGEVATERSKRTAGISQPTPRQMARSSLHVVGSGARVISAYWMHAVQSTIIATLPQWMVDSIAISIAGKMKAEEEAEALKSQ